MDSTFSPSGSPAQTRGGRSRRRSVKSFITQSTSVCGHEDHHRLDTFTQLIQIGSGANGVVFRAINTCNRKSYVIKRINIHSFTREEILKTLQEVHLMRSITHQYIIQLHTYYVEKRSLFMVMELADMGDLQDLIDTYKSHRATIDESFLWRIFSQLCSALCYLHGCQIVHRDVKCQNVLLVGPSLTVKVGDLGLSKSLANTEKGHGQAGTPSYFSPEQIQKHPYDYKVDVWATGCVLYMLSTFAPPFVGESLYALFRNILNNSPLPIPCHYSDRWRSLVMYCLTKSQSDRPTSKQLLDMYPSALSVSSSNKSGNPPELVKAPSFVSRALASRFATAPVVEHPRRPSIGQHQPPHRRRENKVKSVNVKQFTLETPPAHEGKPAAPPAAEVFRMLRNKAPKGAAVSATTIIHDIAKKCGVAGSSVEGVSDSEADAHQDLPKTSDFCNNNTLEPIQSSFPHHDLLQPPRVSPRAFQQAPPRKESTASKQSSHRPNILTISALGETLEDLELTETHSRIPTPASGRNSALKGTQVGTPTHPTPRRKVSISPEPPSFSSDIAAVSSVVSSKPSADLAGPIAKPMGLPLHPPKKSPTGFTTSNPPVPIAVVSPRMLPPAPLPASPMARQGMHTVGTPTTTTLASTLPVATCKEITPALPPASSCVVAPSKSLITTIMSSRPSTLSLSFTMSCAEDGTLTHEGGTDDVDLEEESVECKTSEEQWAMLSPLAKENKGKASPNHSPKPISPHAAGPARFAVLLQRPRTAGPSGPGSNSCEVEKRVPSKLAIDLSAYKQKRPQTAQCSPKATSL